jgi:hypothetical protein
MRFVLSRLALVLFLGAMGATAGCAAASEDAGESGQAVSAEGDDATDREADGETPGRRAQLAALVAKHLEPGADSSENELDADRDEDGIADALEEELLRRYRPYYRFTKANGNEDDKRPSDPVDEIRHAQLAALEGDGDGATGPLDGCGRAGDQRLDPPSLIYSCKPEASLEVSRAPSKLCIRLDDKRTGGPSFEEAKTNATGLLGHVAQDTVSGHPAYKIEYWQFFAFNNQDIRVLGLGSYGDHAGDWTSVQLWFDRTEHRLAKIVYLIHGKAITFNAPPSMPTCRDCTMQLRGAHFDTAVGNFFDDRDRAKYDDNQAEFYVDANGFKHVVAYIERGGHELWPGSWGRAVIEKGPIKVGLNGHAGDGVSYLVPDVQDRPFNAGEVGRPLTSDARTILSFNGYWGCTNDTDLAGPLRRSPVGPALHCSWKFPSSGPVQGCED